LKFYGKQNRCCFGTGSQEKKLQINDRQLGPFSTTHNIASTPVTVTNYSLSDHTTTTTTLHFHAMNRFSQAHERLKQSIHSYWRQNEYLSPRSTAGKIFMSFVYFSIPVVVGYYVSTMAVEMSESTVEERFGTKTDHPTSAHANSSISIDNPNDKIWGIGVHLVSSDEETQEVNRVNLERFLKRQRKLKEKREREAQKNSIS
jgi:hypothetical protein